MLLIVATAATHMLPLITRDHAQARPSLDWPGWHGDPALTWPGERREPSARAWSRPLGEELTDSSREELTSLSAPHQTRPRSRPGAGRPAVLDPGSGQQRPALGVGELLDGGEQLGQRHCLGGGRRTDEPLLDAPAAISSATSRLDAVRSGVAEPDPLGLREARGLRLVGGQDGGRPLVTVGNERGREATGRAPGRGRLVGLRGLEAASVRKRLAAVSVVWTASARCARVKAT